MPFYDLTCPNGHEQVDVLLKIGEHPPCSICSEPTSNFWSGKGSNVIGDDIPGGVEIKHAICHEDGSPKRYYSKSEIARAAKEKGYSNIVTHVTGPGTDKNPYTVRWISTPIISEEERLKNWYAHEKTLNTHPPQTHESRE